MRNRTERLLVGVILVCILALVSTGVGITWILGASASSGNQQGLILQGTPVPGVTHVFMRNFAYQPANIQVVIGTAVTWTNRDNIYHSVVLPHVVTSENVIRESGPLSQGQSFNYTFTSQGIFQYYCLEHPYIVGIVTVT